MLEEVRKEHEQEKVSETKLAEKRQRDRELRQNVYTARCRRRWGQYLHKRIEAGTMWRESLSVVDQRVLREWESGRLLEDLNNAKREYGHGTLVSADGEELRIGGSTGSLYT